MRKFFFRLWRGILGRDNCELCDGRRNVRGNENVIDGIVMCDDCHAARWSYD